MNIVQTLPELKTEPQNNSSFDNQFSVDVKPLHHELLIEDITEEEIAGQSIIQCQPDWIKEEVCKITALNFTISNCIACSALE